MGKIWGSCAAFLLLAQLSAGELPEDFYDRIKKACVEILVDDHLDGSGWLVDSEGLVVTAAHVVPTPGKRIEVMLPPDVRVSATVVCVDRGNDAAVLRIPARPNGYPVLKFAEKMPAAGSTNYLFGAPIQRHGILLKGCVARNDTAFEYYDSISDYVEIVHLTCANPPGTSGGPWLNERGEVVGLNSGMMRDNKAPAGIGFAIPFAPIQRLIVSGKTARTATLGAAYEELWQQKRDFLQKFPPRTEGIVLPRLKAEGPGARGGLKEWDVIISADDTPLRYPDTLLRIIRAKKPGDEIKLKILAPNAEGVKEKTVRLGHLESEWANELKN